ncbi:hypothetical protein [Streptomyces wuyuanensis]|uniref:hypothetical protein n=1 Tax=Streptomyces wuyuanensis TaxID=1196353 RepID=UPI0034494F7E
MGHVPQTRANIARVAAQTAQCLQLRLDGHSFRAIAEQVGLAVSTVHDRVRDAIEQDVNPKADELRALELARLESYLVRLVPRINKGDDKAINTAVRISESRRRLLALDMPVTVHATVHEVTQQDLELQEMIRAAKARVALEEQELRRGSGGEL